MGNSTSVDKKSSISISENIYLNRKYIAEKLAHKSFYTHPHYNNLIDIGDCITKNIKKNIKNNIKNNRNIKDLSVLLTEWIQLYNSVKYHQDTKIVELESEHNCSICIDKIETGSAITKCINNHIFHYDCGLDIFYHKIENNSKEIVETPLPDDIKCPLCRGTFKCDYTTKYILRSMS